MASNQELTEEVKSLKESLKTVTEERNLARKEVIDAASRMQALEVQVEQLQESLTTGAPVDASTAELRLLAAACLPSSKDHSGRPMNASTLRDTAPRTVEVAVELAKEICRQIP